MEKYIPYKWETKESWSSNPHIRLDTQHRSTSIIRQTLTAIKGEEIGSNTITVGDLTTPLTPMDRSLKQKMNKETQVLNDTLDELDLIDIFRIVHLNAEEYTFFSSVHGTLSGIYHIKLQ